MNLNQRRTKSLASFFLHTFIAIFAIGTCSIATAADPLASWNEGPARKAILEFVAAVTDKNGKDYVAPAERIACPSRKYVLPDILDLFQRRRQSVVLGHC